jgi:hypothetical protein
MTSGISVSRHAAARIGVRRELTLAKQHALHPSKVVDICQGTAELSARAHPAHDASANVRSPPGTPQVFGALDSEGTVMPRASVVAIIRKNSLQA